jgi:hypothetical protein
MLSMPGDLRDQVVLRWKTTAGCSALVEAGGVDAVWLEGGPAATGGAEALPAAAIRVVRLDEAASAEGRAVAVKAGIWPGAEAAARGKDGSIAAGASARAWVTANGYLASWLRALYPARPPLLAYEPDRDAGVEPGKVPPLDSVELALVDAWSAGGNWIIAVPAVHQDALLRGDEAAMAAWTRMGRTARWLKLHRALFEQPPMDVIWVLVEHGETTAEIANLMFRESASPRLVTAAQLPAQVSPRPAVIAAAGMAAGSAETRRKLLAYVRGGSTVLTDAAGADAWWRVPQLKTVREFEDRRFFALGEGRIVAYNDPISDPSDFAQDAIDLAGDHRPARIWDCPGGIAMASGPGPEPGSKPLLKVVNYGSRTRSAVLARRSGVFRSATLLRPEAEPAPLRVYKRGGSTEVVLPGVERLAAVVFD